MKKYILYNDVKYYLQSTNHYYSASPGKSTPRLLHRKIWTDNHGDIPPGYVVHHKDHDWQNNDINNLELVERIAHYQHHARERYKDPEYKEKVLNELAKSQPLTKEWHSTKKGLKWHTAHGHKTWKEKVPHFVKCKWCKKDALVKAVIKPEYCSVQCRRKAKYKHYSSDKRSCIMCKKEFMVYKYYKTRCCSRKCGARLRLSVL